MNRILILGGDTDFNKGDQATLASMIELFKQEIPKIRIKVLALQPEKTRKWYKVDPIDRHLASLFKQLTSISDSDLVVWGGGVALQDNTSLVKIPYWLLKIITVKSLGKKVVGYAQGIGPIDTKLGILLTKIIMLFIDSISVRDPDSANLLENIGVKKRIHVTVDPAVALEPLNEEKMKRILENLFEIQYGQNPIIGIAPRRWFHLHRGVIPHKYVFKYITHSTRGQKEFNKFKNNMAVLMDYLVTKLNAKILFIPMYPVAHEADDKVSQEIIDKMRFPSAAKILTADLNPNELMAMIGLLDMVIGVRMHCTILSTAMGVPSINIYYVSKGLEYFKMIGQQDRAISIYSLLDQEGLKRILKITDDVWTNRNSIRDELTRVTNLKTIASQNVRLVKTALEH